MSTLDPILVGAITVSLLTSVARAIARDRDVRMAITLVLACLDAVIAVGTVAAGHSQLTATVWAAVAALNLWWWWNDDDVTRRRRRTARRLGYKARAALSRLVARPVPAGDR